MTHLSGFGIHSVPETNHRRRAMQLSVDYLRLHIRSTLQLFGYWSPSAEEMLLSTSAQESHCGATRKQIGGGPGRGIYQIELNTEIDIWKNFLLYRSDLKERIFQISGVSGPDPIALEHNLTYQHLLCRCYYLRIKEMLPKADDIYALAWYWKRYFNTLSGKGNEEEFVQNYKLLIAGH